MQGKILTVFTLARRGQNVRRRIEAMTLPLRGDDKNKRAHTVDATSHQRRHIAIDRRSDAA